MKPPRVYLDTTIVSALAKDEFPGKELDAMRRLLRWHEQDLVPLVTSDIMEQELAKIPEHYRAKHDELYNLLLKVPSLVPLTRMSLMGTPTTSLESFALRALERLLPDRADARHVAWRSGGRR